MNNNNEDDKNIDFEVTRRNSTHEFLINGKQVLIDTFFNVLSWKKYFEFSKESDDYKKSFAKTVFFMYCKTVESEEKEAHLTEQDFIRASDSELFLVMTAIMGDDSRLLTKYNEIEKGDQYTKFYEANKNSFEDVFAPLKEVFENQKRATANINLTTLQKIVEQNRVVFDSSYINSLNKLYIPSIARVAEIQASSLNVFSQHLNTINLSGIKNATLAFNTNLQSIMKAIPKFDFFEKLKPLLSYFEQNRDFFASAAIGIQNALASIDFSMMTYHIEWSERHDFLLSHGWFYLNELPREIIDEIYERKETMTTEQIDKQICDYFRENKCTALKTIVKKWSVSPYFKVREHIFHQALVNHSRKYYNTSITLMAIHTEGVITDFLRLKLQNPKFKATSAISEIRDIVEEMPLESLSLSDWQIYDEILYRVLSAFSESFSHSNPETASNSSRHKIAHGHVVAKETEASSLRHFLYMNEICRLFMKLDILLDAEESIDGDSSDIQ